MIKPIYALLLVLLLLNRKIAAAEEEDNETSLDKKYSPPHNVQYPYGDELQMDYNVLDNDTNKIPCDLKNVFKLKGGCPSTDEEGIPSADLHIPCPDNWVVPAHELIYSSVEHEPPQVQCKQCNLRTTSDGKAVIVECYHCFDVPSPLRPANRTEKNILYKAHFVEIANYTSVSDISGRQYF